MRPFDHLRDQLLGAGRQLEDIQVRGDIGRHDRTGGAEIVFAGPKTADQILAGVVALIDRSGRVVISQIRPEIRAEFETVLPDGLVLTMAPGNRAGVVSRIGVDPPAAVGRVAVLSAGTSDIPVAAEAALVATEHGCSVSTTWDVGVAGIHRLVRPLEAMIAWDPDVFIVVAGMDGILPTVVTGLVRQPVIGLPTSTGYGFGGEGLGALTTMLQSCAPGLAVVNIDNGVGAGVIAARIAIRAARDRPAPTA